MNDPQRLFFPIDYPDYKPKLDQHTYDAINEARARLAGVFDLCKRCASEERIKCSLVETVEWMHKERAFENMSFGLRHRATLELLEITEQISKAYERGCSLESPQSIRTKDVEHLARPPDLYDVEVHQYLTAALRRAEAMHPDSEPGRSDKLTRSDAETLAEACMGSCQVLESYVQENMRQGLVGNGKAATTN